MRRHKLVGPVLREQRRLQGVKQRVGREHGELDLVHVRQRRLDASVVLDPDVVDLQEKHLDEVLDLLRVPLELWRVRLELLELTAKDLEALHHGAVTREVIESGLSLHQFRLEFVHRRKHSLDTHGLLDGLRRLRTGNNHNGRDATISLGGHDRLGGDLVERLHHDGVAGQNSTLGHNTGNSHGHERWLGSVECTETLEQWLEYSLTNGLVCEEVGRCQGYTQHLIHGELLLRVLERAGDGGLNAILVIVHVQIRDVREHHGQHLVQFWIERTRGCIRMMRGCLDRQHPVHDVVRHFEQLEPISWIIPEQESGWRGEAAIKNLAELAYRQDLAHQGEELAFFRTMLHDNSTRHT